MHLLTKWLVSLMTMTAILDTGQALVHNMSTTVVDKCRKIGDGCSCPQTQPHYLRCLGQSGDLETILSNLNAADHDEFQVKLLDVTLVNLGVLKHDTFAKFQLNLSALVITASHLKIIEPGALRSLNPFLTALSLPNNLLDSIPDEILSLPLLGRLDLSQNHINIWNDKLADVSLLNFLDLGDNHISDINDVKIPISLNSLSLKSNKLELESIRRFNFWKLRDLDFSSNALNGSLSSRSFANKADHLRKLDLSFNKLVSIGSQALAKFPRLRYLILKSNNLQLLDPQGFQGLPKLRSLDLSSNGIIEIPSDVFRPLTSLEVLDLSDNYLQVVSGSLTFGLVKLTTLRLSNNDIIRVEPLKDVEAKLTNLILDSNPLECSCQMRSFQIWLKTMVHLTLTSKQSVRCSTPTKYANAILNSLQEPLNCDDDESSDILDEDNPIAMPDQFYLLSRTSSSAQDLTLKWAVVPSIGDFKCDQVQLYQLNNAGDRVQFYSSPLSCQANQTVLEVSLDLRKIGHFAQRDIRPEAAILACATILVPTRPEVKKGQLEPVTNCTNIQLPTGQQSQYNQYSKASLASIKATSALFGQVDVTFEVTEAADDPECKLALQVEAGSDRVVASNKVGCQDHNVSLSGLQFEAGLLRVCGWLELGPTSWHTGSKCAKVELLVTETTSMASSLAANGKEAPILALVLTLVFLGIGIAALVVLYLIVKGYLSDRQKANLLQMRLCPSAIMQNNNNVSEHTTRRRPTRPSILRWPYQLLPWKRCWHHRPVPASDEMALREDSTYDTSVV